MFNMSTLDSGCDSLAAVDAVSDAASAAGRATAAVRDMLDRERVLYCGGERVSLTDPFCKRSVSTGSEDPGTDTSDVELGGTIESLPGAGGRRFELASNTPRAAAIWPVGMVDERFAVLKEDDRKSC